MKTQRMEKKSGEARSKGRYRSRSDLLALLALLGLFTTLSCSASSTSFTVHHPESSPQSTSHGEGREQEARRENLVKFSLEQSRAPDGQEHLLATFAIPAGWHIYWIHPGDSGLATEVRSSVKEQVFSYPAPVRHIESGDIETFVYENSVSLFANWLDAEKVEGEKIRIQSDWLVCKDICVPESATVAFDDSNPVTQVDWEERLPSYRRLPKPMTNELGRIVVSERDHQSLKYSIELVRGQIVDFYPYSSNLLRFEGLIQAPNSHARLRFRLAEDSGQSTLNFSEMALGVIAVREDSGELSFVEIETPKGQNPSNPAQGN